VKFPVLLDTLGASVTSCSGSSYTHRVLLVTAMLARPFRVLFEFITEVLAPVRAPSGMLGMERQLQLGRGATEMWGLEILFS